MALKLVHTADFHLGVSFSSFFGGNISEVRKSDFLGNMMRIADYAVDNKAHIVVVAGDIFHVSNPSPKDLVAFSEFLGKLLSKDLRVVAIAGNHDVPKTVHGRNPLEAFKLLNLKNFYFYSKPPKKPLILDTDAGKVGVVVIPYINPSVIKALSKNVSYENVIKSLIKVQLDGIPGSVDYRILVAHLHVDEARFTDYFGIYSNEPTVSRVALIETEFDYVALGHIHIPQKISSRIFYSGSIERISFAEEKEEKKFIFAEVGSGEPKVNFLPLPCRPMRTIKVDWRGLNAHAIVNSVRSLNFDEGSLVKIIATLDSNSWRAVDRALPRIQEELESKGVVGFKLTKEYAEAALRIDVKKDWKTNILEHVRDYISKMNELPEVRDRAIKYAKEVIEEVKES